MIQMEIKDPKVGFISVSDVEVSRDLAHAKVFVTVFNADEAKDSIAALKRAAGYLRRRLGQELRMRSVPELHFRHDSSVETGQRMDSLIARAMASHTPSDGEAEEGPTEPETDE